MSEFEPVDTSEVEDGYVQTSVKGHPAEVALFGFIAGVVDVVVVPGVFVTVVTNFWQHARFNVLSLSLATLFLPVLLLISGKTRKFAESMILGGAVTAFALAAVVLTFKTLLDS